MKKRVLKNWIAVSLSISILLSGCGMQKTVWQEARPDSGAEQQEREEQEYEHEQMPQSTSPMVEGKAVVMLYMVGSDLESEAGLASTDIVEMIESGYNTKNMDVVVCTGGARDWWIDGLSDSNCEVYQLSGEGLDPVYRLKNKNMGDEDTLKEFINYVYANHSGEYYDLIMWNHGGGAVLGFGADENYAYDCLSMTEIKSALDKTRFIGEGNKFEFIGFDACLMGMIEVADVLSDYANYMIASEEVEAGTGWDYDCLKALSDGAHFDGASAGKEIIDTFSESSESQVGYRYDYTLSCLDLSKVDETVDSLETLIVEAQDEIKRGGYSKIARQRDETKTFGKVSSTSFYDTVDLYDLAAGLMKLYPHEAKELLSDLEELVVYERSNVNGAHGVAVYFPYENKDYLEAWMKEYKNLAFSNEYVAFLEDFTATLSGEQLAEWNIMEIVPKESEEIAGEYYVQLTPEQAANYGSAKFSVWEEDSEGTYISWMLSSDVTLSEDGVLSSPFKGERFYLTDDSGVMIPCTAIEVERNEEYSIFSLIVWVTRGIPGDKVFMYDSFDIHVRVDEEHPEGEIAGIYRMRDEDDTLFPEKSFETIEEGDYICEFLFARDIVFNGDGSVAPFDEWESSSGMGGGFTLEGELRVVLAEPEESGEYLCLFNIKDTQGNTCYTNPIYVQY